MEPLSRSSQVSVPSPSLTPIIDPLLLARLLKFSVPGLCRRQRRKVSPKMPSKMKWWRKEKHTENGHQFKSTRRESVRVNASSKGGPKEQTNLESDTAVGTVPATLKRPRSVFVSEEDNVEKRVKVSKSDADATATFDNANKCFSFLNLPKEGKDMTMECYGRSPVTARSEIPSEGNQHMIVEENEDAPTVKLPPHETRNDKNLSQNFTRLESGNPENAEVLAGF
ncbi:hypothetical protein DDE82_005919 [Stemphylium lycopersici]|nr:hypothetical protein DDE82_005919 [Stemphylium lycopersici]